MESSVQVLIIDDSRHIRDFVAQTLSAHEEFSLRQAVDGAEGLEMALADPPDLILLDLEMPQLNGLQVLENLQARQVGIPVILITSYGSESIAVEVFRKGVKDYLIKPFTAEEMLDAIDRALTEVRLRRERDSLTERLAAANQQLRRRVDELDTLYRVGKSISSRISQKQVLEQIVDAVFEIIDAEEAQVMLLNQETCKLETELHRHRIPDAERRMEDLRSTNVVAEAARKGDSTASGAMLAAPLKVGDRVIGVLGVGNPTTNRLFTRHDRQLVLALADYGSIAIQNAQLYENLRQADHAKTEFVSLMVQELDTPPLADRQVDEIAGPLARQLEDSLGAILSGTHQMQALVSNLRDIAQIESGQLALRIFPVSIREPVEEALRATRGQILAQSQHLSVDVPDDLPPVYVDPPRITQVLVNLLSNASKYTPVGGHVSVRAWLRDDEVHCAVSDSGIGISPGDQERLFSKFFRSDDPVVQHMPGTGLGLCIVKSLVRLHGGRIEVESQQGRGTTFVFTLRTEPLGEGRQTEE